MENLWDEVRRLRRRQAEDFEFLMLGFSGLRDELESRIPPAA